MERHRDRPPPGVSNILLLLIVGSVVAGGWFLGTLQAPNDPTTPVSITALRSDPPDQELTASNESYDPPFPSEDHAANLPDGTEFLARFATDQPTEVRNITAGIVMDVPSGDAAEVGAVWILPEQSGRPTAEGSFQRTFGGWTLIIEPTAEVSLGVVDFDAWIDDHIVDLPGRRLPAYQLVPPLRWADDSEGPPMSVEFITYAVRRGCSEAARACSETHAVQLLSTDPDTSIGASVSSPAPRPNTDPHYVNPGPLSARRNHRVAWTGSEVVVWGGDNGQESLTDGAAFDPEGSTWRWLPDSPFQPDSATSSVWAGDRLIAFDETMTAQYLPSSNSWGVLGTGVPAPASVDLAVWSGGSVYVWSDEIYRFDSPAWSVLPAPGANPGSAWETALVGFDETVYAVYLPWGDCSSRQITRWTGSSWTPISQPPESASNASCSSPRQVIAAHPLLYAWSEGNEPLTVYDPRTDTWSTVGVLPDLKPTSVAEPVGIGYQILLSNRDEGWIYSPTTNAWTSFDLPGSTSPSTGVWTGTELINWGRSCCDENLRSDWGIDAWRLVMDP